MIIITNIDLQKFSLNGVPYFKNFTPFVIGNKLKIVNTYDSKFCLTEFENFANFQVDGNVYSSLIDLQTILLPIIFTRDTLGSLAISFPEFNRFTVQTGFSLNANNLTINSGWSWLLNANTHTNPSSVTIAVPFCLAGKNRIDLIVATDTNTFIRIPGLETSFTPVAPTDPANTVRATFLVISDSQISQPTPPASGQSIFTYASIIELESTASRPRFGDTAFILNATQNLLAQCLGNTWVYLDLASAGTPLKKLFKWTTGDPLTFNIGAGNLASNVFVDRVPMIGLSDTGIPFTAEWSQSGNVVTLSSSVIDAYLFNNSLIYIT